MPYILAAGATHLTSNPSGGHIKTFSSSVSVQHVVPGVDSLGPKFPVASTTLLLYMTALLPQFPVQQRRSPLRWRDGTTLCPPWLEASLGRFFLSHSQLMPSPYFPRDTEWGSLSGRMNTENDHNIKEMSLLNG